MRSRYFPFYALGFRSNPFRTLSDEEWGEIAILPEPALAALAEGFVHLQVTGPIGSGKSSTLRGLAAHYARQGMRIAFEHLPPDQRDWRTDLRGLDVFCLDEAQWLGGRQRDRLLDAVLRGGGHPRLVFSSHEDLAPLFARRSLPLTTMRLGARSKSHLRAVVEARLAYFALGAEPAVTLTADAIDWLYETYGSDLRAAECLLYEVFHALEEPGPITAALLRLTADRVARTRS